MHQTQFRADKPKGKPPAGYPGASKDWIDRRAKLFEAGDYPDKKLNVSPEQIAALTASFAEPVPILIEHATSPLEIGYLTAVEAVGHELFGTVALTPEAHALIERSGAQSLSIGLAPDLSRIVEVSLVDQPRVPTARLFDDSICFEGSIIEPTGWKARFDALQQEVIDRAAQETADAYVREGKLLPSQQPFAAALLADPGTVRFGNGLRPVRELLIEMLAMQPKHALFKEHAPQKAEDLSSVLMMPEEADFYRKHFPDVALEEIAKRRA